MALSATTHRINPDAAGNTFLVYQDGSSRNCQAVALVGESGEHVGIEDVPLHVCNIDFSHFEIHEGDSYWFHEVVTLGSGATQDYLLTVPDTTKWPHFGYQVEASFGVTVELYEGADRTGTSAQTTYNRQRNSGNTAGLTIHKGTSGGTTDGTKIVWRKSGTGTAGGKLAGFVGSGSERVLKQNTKYVLRLTSAAASNDVSLELDWYEHTFP